MTVVEAVLVFAGIPLVVILGVVGLVYGPSGGPKSRRYRPGRPFEFTPVWFLSRPEGMTLAGAAVDEATAPSTAKAITSGDDVEKTGLFTGPVKGGASGSW